MENSSCERQAGGRSWLSATERSADSARPPFVPAAIATNRHQRVRLKLEGFSGLHTNFGATQGFAIHAAGECTILVGFNSFHKAA